MNLREEIQERAGEEPNEEFNSDEELNEGLRIFKQSLKFKKYADKIEAKLVSAKAKGKIEASQVKIIENVIREAQMGAQEFERIETKFKEKTLDRSKAKIELQRLKKKYGGLVKKLKSDKVKTAMKIIGAAAILTSILGVLFGLGIGTTSSSVLMTGSDFRPGKIYNFNN